LRDRLTQDWPGPSNGVVEVDHDHCAQETFLK
jgi:hypothetical protein